MNYRDLIIIIIILMSIIFLLLLIFTGNSFFLTLEFAPILTVLWCKSIDKEGTEIRKFLDKKIF
jgi:uncharacterized membrane protein YqiK